MRPASEIHSSLEMIESELARLKTESLRRLQNILAGDDSLDAVGHRDAIRNLSIVRDVLRWAMGGHWTDLTDGDDPWLVAYLLDDPPKINDTPTEEN